MVISLDRMAIGGSGAVVPGDSGLGAVTRQRLIHQGVVPGTVLTVLQRTTGGGRILAVGRTRIAVDPDVVRGIYVDAPGAAPGARP